MFGVSLHLFLRTAGSFFTRQPQSFHGVQNTLNTFALSAIACLSACRMLRRNFNEHMHMIIRQNTLLDTDAHLTADLARNLPNTVAHFLRQNFKAIFGNPNDMIAVMIGRMRSSIMMIAKNGLKVLLTDSKSVVLTCNLENKKTLNAF